MSSNMIKVVVAADRSEAAAEGVEVFRGEAASERSEVVQVEGAGEGEVFRGEPTAKGRALYNQSEPAAEGGSTSGAMAIRSPAASMTSRASSPGGGVPTSAEVGESYTKRELAQARAGKQKEEVIETETGAYDPELAMLADRVEGMIMARRSDAPTVPTVPAWRARAGPSSSADMATTANDDEQQEAPRKVFRPARILTSDAAVTGLRHTQRAEAAGVNENRTNAYLGEVSRFDILNRDVSDNDNHAIHIIGIASTATVAEILSVFSGVRIFSFHRLAPVPGERPDAAANMTLMTRAMAESVLVAINSPRGLTIRGQRISAIWNRHRVGTAALARYQSMSRVVVIRGPRDDLKRDASVSFFEGQFQFDLVSSRDSIIRDGRREVVLVFSSIRAQAENADMLMRQCIEDSAQRPTEFDVEFGPDPCAVARYRPRALRNAN